MTFAIAEGLRAQDSNMRIILSIFQIHPVISMEKTRTQTVKKFFSPQFV